MDKKTSPHIPTFCVLVTSIGGKAPLLSAVREALARFAPTTKLIGGDSNPNCPGRYLVDQFQTFPADPDLHLAWLIENCNRLGINAIIPTRDAELSFYSRHRKALQTAGISVMISPFSAVETCLDKLKFSTTLQAAGLTEAIPASDNLESLAASSYVVKERFGAGARSILLDVPAERALRHAETLAAPIFQPFVAGQELSIDLYLNQTSQPLGVVARSRDLVINGEAQISTTIDAPDLEALCCDIATKIGLTGHLVFQVILDQRQRPHIVECNCRFGGASTLGLAAGLESFLWFFTEASDRDPRQIPFVRPPHQLRQVRYPTDMVLELTAEHSGGAHA